MRKKTIATMMIILFLGSMFVFMIPGFVSADDEVITLVGTGDPNIDVPAVQAAVDQGGTILLKGTFDFGTGTVYITTTVTIRGEGSENTKICGGGHVGGHYSMETSAFMSMEGANPTIEEIWFDGAAFAAIYLFSCNGATIRNNKITGVIPETEKWGWSPAVFGIWGGALFEQIYANDPMSSYYGEPVYGFKGSILIEENEVDLMHLYPAGWYDIYDGITIFDVPEASFIHIEKNLVKTPQNGITVEGTGTTPSLIKKNTIEGSPSQAIWTGTAFFTQTMGPTEISKNEIINCRWAGIRLAGLDGSSIVTKNIIKGFNGPGWVWTSPIYVRNDNQGCIISKNKFININGAPAAILLRPNSNNNYNIIEKNNFEESGLPGWTDETPDGPGCILLHEGTLDNVLAENLFPEGTFASTQILDLGDNIILE
jgi:hypothetical protein